MRTTQSEWSEEVQETLDIVRRKALVSQRHRASVFDFDNTCISGDCGALIHSHISRTFRWNFEQGILPHISDALGRSRIERLLEDYREPSTPSAHVSGPEPTLLSPTAKQLYSELIFIFPRHMKQFGPAETYAWATRLYAGLAVESLREMAREMIRHEGRSRFYTEQIASTSGQEPSLTIHHGIRKRPAIRAMIEDLDDLGVTPSIVSASNEWTVEEASRWTGVPRERVHGNRSETLDGTITASARRPASWGPGKVTIAREISEFPPLLAIGDSRTDRELLDYAEHAILIDCGDAELVSYGRAKGWAITEASSLSEEPLSVE